ncbi:MAG: serine hydrolase domain-containing protein [Myxococcota bacterium]
MAPRTLLIALMLVPVGLGPLGCSAEPSAEGETAESSGGTTDPGTTDPGTTDPGTTDPDPDSTGDPPGTGSSTGNEPDERFAEFDQALEQFIEDEGLPGLTAAVVHRDDGVLHLRGYGAFEADRVTLIASASKIISVGVLMRLAEQGALDLDTPISEYLSDWGEYKTDITVAQLVSNSSGMIGLSDALYAEYLCQFLSAQTLEACGQSLYTADDAATSVPPDTEFRYGGAQWQLAGAVAEVVSGESWADLVQQTYAPCGLTSTEYRNHFMQASIIDGGATVQYPSFVDGDMSVLDTTQNPSIEGGAFSNAEDYAQLLLMHLRGGQCDDGPALDEASVMRMQGDRILDVYGGSTGSPGFDGYGLGWWVDRNTGIISDFGAYGTNPWLDLDRGYGAVVFVEGQSWMGTALYLELEPILAAVFDEA